MQIISSNYNSSEYSNNNHSSINNSSKLSFLVSTPTHPEQIGAISSFDKVLLTAQKAGLIDRDGLVLEDVKKKYPLKPLNEEEVERFVTLLTDPISQTFFITSSEKVTLDYSLLDYFQFLIAEAAKNKILITSINMVGGKVPEILKSYYIRTLNELYKDRCLELNLEPMKDGLFLPEVAADLDRKAPDIDIVSTIKADFLGLLEKLDVVAIEKCLSQTCTESEEVRKKLIRDYKERAISKKKLDQPADREIDLAISAAALAFVNNLGVRYFAGKLDQKYGNQGQKSSIIKRYYYHQFCTINSPGSNPFAMVSFGPAHRLVDSTTVHEGRNKGFYSHHGMSVELMALINGNVNKMTIPKKATSLHELVLVGGWQSLIDRTTRTLRIEGNVEELNDRSWFPWIYNKCIGYSISDPHTQEKLYRKITYPILPHLQKHWKNHLTSEYLPFLCFNAIVSLPENVERKEKIQAWRMEIMSWSPADIELQGLKKAPNELEFPFLHCLKETLKHPSIPFDVCRDILQIHGCLLQSSPQPEGSQSHLKVHITNPNGKWHEVCILQNYDNKTYAISIPLNLSEAIATLLKSDACHLDMLADLVKPLCPQDPYRRELIPSAIITDQLADVALLCLEHPHKALKNLGFELLLLYALSHSKPWILKNLIKSFLVVLESMDTSHHAKLMVNLENALKSIPNDIGTRNLTNPIMHFCRSKKSASKDLSLELCHVMVSTGDPDLIHGVVNYHLNHEKIALDDRIKLVKSLLPTSVSEAVKLFSKMQKQKFLSIEEELKIFNEISEVVKKSGHSHIYHTLIFSLSDCVEQLIQRDKNQAREAALIMVQASFDQGHMKDARRWMKRILLMTTKSDTMASESDEAEKLFFVPQDVYFNLLSLQLPPKAPEALNMLLGLNEGELKLFILLFEQLPQAASMEPEGSIDKAEAASLKELAKKFLLHKESLFQRIGFELLMLHMKAVPSIEKDKQIINKDMQETIDGRCLALISYLPMILSSVNQEIRTLLLNGMKGLLPATYEKYLSTLNVTPSQTKLKESISNYHSKAKPKISPTKENSAKKPALIQMSPIQKAEYQANCAALASTTKAYELIKKLVSRNYINRGLGLDFTDPDQIEITFATIKALLPEGLFSVIEILEQLEKENNAYKSLAKQSIFASEKKGIFIDIIERLIKHNDLEKAMAQLFKCLKSHTFSNDEVRATELWLNLCSIGLSSSQLCPMSIAESWKSLRNQGVLPNKPLPEQQVDLIIHLIQNLNDLKNQSADSLATELRDFLKEFTLTEAQKSKLSFVIINDFMQSEILDLHKLKESYQILIEENLSWAKEANVDPVALILFWLTASKVEMGNLQEEFIGLLAKAMKMIENLSADDKRSQIREMAPFIIAALQKEIMKGRAFKEFKDQIIALHPSIAESLQTSHYADLFFDYFHALHQHQLLDKISENMINPCLWLIDEVLNKYHHHSEKILTTHHLCKLHFCNGSSLPIDADKGLIPMKLAKALIAHDFHDAAKDWIKLTIKMQKNKLLENLSDDLIECLKIFLSKEDSHFCLDLLDVLSTSPHALAGERKETLCLEISKAFLNKCSVRMREAIESTFFLSPQKKVKNDIDHESALDRRFEMTQMLFASSNRDLQLCGISMLSTPVVEILQECVLKDPKKWAELYDRGCKIWLDLHANKRLVFSSKIKAVINQQSLLIQQMPDSHLSCLAKNLELFKLNVFCNEDFQNIKSCFDQYSKNLANYSTDEEWAKKSIKIFVENFVDWSMTHKDPFIFQCRNVLFVDFFMRHKIYNHYCLELIKLILNLKLEDSEFRTTMIYIAGLAVDYVLDRYYDILNKPQTQLSEEESKKIEEIIDLTEKILLCPPVINKDWIVKKPADDFSVLHFKIVEKFEKFDSEELEHYNAVYLPIMVRLKKDVCFQENNEVKKIDRQIVLDEKQDKPNFKMLDANIPNFFKKLSSTVSWLISQNNYHSIYKSMLIIHCTQEQIWHKYGRGMIELFSIVMQSDYLYPDQLSKVGDLIFLLPYLIKNEIERKEILTKVCISFYKKLQQDSIFNSSSLKSEIHDFAQNFLLSCLVKNIFDRNDKIFVQFFEFQLEWYLKSKSLKENFHFMKSFIELSLEPFPGDQNELLLDIISSKIDRIMISYDQLPEASVQANYNIFDILYRRKYFDKPSRNLEHVWQVLFNLTSKYIVRNNAKHNTMVALCGSLLVIFGRLYKYDSNNERRVTIYTLISNNMDKLLSKNEDCYEDNVNMISLLNFHDYYKDNLKEFEEAKKLLKDQRDKLQERGKTISLTGSVLLDTWLKKGEESKNLTVYHF